MAIDEGYLQAAISPVRFHRASTAHPNRATHKRRGSKCRSISAIARPGRPAVWGFTATEVLAELVDPTDLEDIVLIYLQAEDWLLMPSTRQKSTLTYEAAFRSLEDGSLAVVSVKSGDAQVPIPELAREAGEARAFAFGDNLSAPPEQYGVERITSRQIEEFMAQRHELLPPRISRWLDP